MMGNEEMRDLIRQTETDAVLFLLKTGWLQQHDRAISGTEREVEDAEVLGLKDAEGMAFVWLENYNIEQLVAVRPAGRTRIFSDDYEELHYWKSGEELKLPVKCYGTVWRLWDAKPTWALQEGTPWEEQTGAEE